MLLVSWNGYGTSELMINETLCLPTFQLHKQFEYFFILLLMSSVCKVDDKLCLTIRRWMTPIDSPFSPLLGQVLN
jgi:hypothetical protein